MPIDKDKLAEQDDPFTQCNKAIWDALLLNGRIREWVPKASRISTVPRGDEFGGGKDTPLDYAGAPELLVTQAGYTFLLSGRNSKTVDGQQTFTIQVATDVLDTVPLNVMKWEMLKAFHRACQREHPFGLSFVRTVTPQQAQEGTNPQATRGIPGWVGVMGLLFEFYFPRSMLV